MNLLKRYSVAGLVLAICFALISPMVPAGAANFQRITDTISDSDLGASSVTHTIVASTTVAIQNNGYIEFVFPSGFTNIASSNLTCPTGGAASSSATNVLACDFAGGLAIGSSTFVLTGTTNPSTRGSYIIRAYSKDYAGVLIESASFVVFVIENVDVSATVDPTLIFNIDGTGTSTEVNTVDTTGSSTYDTLAFGTLTPNSSSTLAQNLFVTTNAAYGYTVTVQQDNDLTSDAGADIDTFVNGVAASTTAVAWQSPTGSLSGGENTYGHFGFTSQDENLSGGNTFGDALYKGFYNSDPVEVMYHTGAADGSEAHIGASAVAYTLEISPLQEAGEYRNTLTYICTPTF